MGEHDELLRGLREGTADAQRAFWKRKRPEVEAICARVVGSGDLAREVADGVLVDFLFDCVKRLEHAAAMDSYLRLMATRRALRARTRRLELVEVPTSLADDAAQSPETAAMSAQLLPRLERCLRRLTPKAREVVRLRYYRDLTQEEIGGLVGASKQYIGRVLKQSHAFLRDCMEMTHV